MSGAVTNVIIATPPFAGRRRRIESGILRATSVKARALEWEKITGASETSSASLIVPGEVCERSTSIPILFISRTTSFPNGVSPPLSAESAAASAQSRVTLWVSVMYRAPSS